MAAPTYAHDLTDIDTAESTANWAESTNTTWDDGGGPTQDGDSHLQNTYCISATTSQLKTGYATLIADNGGGITVPTDGAILVWQYYTAPNAIDTFANGGQMVVVGSSLADFDYWNSGGNDFPPNPYGGWKNVPVDPAQSATGTVGTPTATIQFMGAAIKGLRSISKGNPFCVDVIRYGRCEARFTDGDSGSGYCTFAGFAAVNDAQNARLGLLQAVGGGYLWKGLMTVGYSTKAEFVDSDVNISIDDVRNVSSGFNAIEVRQSGTVLNWTRVNFTSLGTVSPGSLEMIDAADVDMDACSFIDMSTFIFLATADIVNTTFLRCDLITAVTAVMNGSKILLSTVGADASALDWDVATDPDGYLDDMTFSRGALAHHAIEFGPSAPADVTVNGWTVSGFNAADGQNDSVFYNNTGGALVINVVGSTGTFTYKNGSGASTTIVINPVTTTILVKDENGDVYTAEDALVRVEAGDDSGDLPYMETVTSINRSGSTATVVHTGHGLVTGDKVIIRYPDQLAYRGVFTITWISVDSYSYEVVGTPDTPATGTIKASGVVAYGWTSVAGLVTGSRTFTVDQNVRGVVRKSEASPYYKDARFTDVVDKDTGLTKVVQLVLDE